MELNLAKMMFSKRRFRFIQMRLILLVRECSKEALTGKLSKLYKHFIYKVSDTGTFDPLVFNSDILLKISIVSNFAKVKCIFDNEYFSLFNILAFFF
jgi:hypothetical protein